MPDDRRTIHVPATVPAVGRPELWRYAPLVVIALLTAYAFGSGLYRQLSLEAVGMNYEALAAYIAAHRTMAMVTYLGTYLLVVALSLPGAAAMTITGGLLFGWRWGAALAALAATAGAVVVYLVAGTSLGVLLAKRCGGWLEKLKAGLQSNALSYTLFLRLVPLFPFFVVNLVAGLLHVPFGPFLLGTAIGILPTTVIFAVAGDGLADTVLAQNAAFHECQARLLANPGMTCTYKIDTGALLTPELMFGLAGIACLALVPVVAKKWIKRDATV